MRVIKLTGGVIRSVDGSHNVSHNAFMTLGNYVLTMVLSHNSSGVINTIKASLEGRRMLTLKSIMIHVQLPVLLPSLCPRIVKHMRLR